MAIQNDDTARAYLNRKIKNLNYFKQHLPRIYQVLDNQMLTRAELVVTPGAADVDMVVDGHSCYKGLAKEYSLDEVTAFLEAHPSDQNMNTFMPPWPETYSKPRFAFRLIQQIMLKSPVTPENFHGYKRGNVFPSMVFLGCGLGFHIEALVERATITNAIVVEREPEKFALSLFTVDWARICSRFQKRGFSLNFAIGFASTEGALRNLLSAHVSESVPLYPYLTIYYNHLADVELARTAMDLGRDLALISSTWSNYDDELLRLKNSLSNIRSGVQVLANKRIPDTGKPLVVVGSGPSLDDRISALRETREQVVLISAGTGLRPLLTAGIIPDLHVELDPSYVIYELHSDADKALLSRITLLAVNEVSPYVASLFGQTLTFFKSENCIPLLANVQAHTFNGCNPTCTNAALSIGYSLGFRTVYLFGTDYGYVDKNQDHSAYSAYGAKAVGQHAEQLRKKQSVSKRQSFRVPAASGEGEVWTRSDYYAAKVSMEKLVQRFKEDDSEFAVSNCSDGASISEAEWLGEADYRNAVMTHRGSGRCDLASALQKQSFSLPRSALDDTMPEVIHELARHSELFSKKLSQARLRGRKDLALLTNELRLMARTTRPSGRNGVTKPEELYAMQMLNGTLLHFIHVVICHGFACEDEDLTTFLDQWRKGFLEFLANVPKHFSEAVLQVRSIDDDPWVKMSFDSPEP